MEMRELGIAIESGERGWVRMRLSLKLSLRLTLERHVDYAVMSLKRIRCKGRDLFYEL